MNDNRMSLPGEIARIPLASAPKDSAPVPTDLSLSDLRLGLIGRACWLREGDPSPEDRRTAQLLDRASGRIGAALRLVDAIQRAPKRGRKAKKAHKAKVLDMARRLDNREWWR